MLYTTTVACRMIKPAIVACATVTLAAPALLVLLAIECTCTVRFNAIASNGTARWSYVLEMEKRAIAASASARSATPSNASVAAMISLSGSSRCGASRECNSPAFVVGSTFDCRYTVLPFSAAVPS